MGITELALLKWAHIIAMVYWLGGEWGVFTSSRFVVDRSLSLEERGRHMETAYFIDIPARTGIILLLPIGLHMGNIWGLQPFGGMHLMAMWMFVAAWLAICWSAFFLRGTDYGVKLTKIDESFRYVIIPVLVISAVSSLMGYGPFEAGIMQKWFSIKVGLYGGLLIIGLVMRYIMREWVSLFRILAEGPDVDAENRLASSMRLGRTLAYFYWVGIATVAFFGVAKFI